MAFELYYNGFNTVGAIQVLFDKDNEEEIKGVLGHRFISGSCVHLVMEGVDEEGDAIYKTIPGDGIFFHGYDGAIRAANINDDNEEPKGDWIVSNQGMYSVFSDYQFKLNFQKFDENSTQDAVKSEKKAKAEPEKQPEKTEDKQETKE
jgi:hypothetical protein